MNNKWDIEELAYRAIGKTDEEAEKEINNGDIEQAVYDKYECSFETYCSIVNDLLKFTPLVSSPLTGKNYHAFVDTEQHRVIVKLDV